MMSIDVKVVHLKGICLYICLNCFTIQIVHNREYIELKPHKNPYNVRVVHSFIMLYVYILRI
jgi:hypothetical protein